ncbi:GNAT family N-acetyltransferase [Spirosoma soli]|uniref:GNAT family N-acetyltransferase n=1 Tax=Spirosoma soli TaxID=1770529 RepID=A0ABW5M7L9_9BACT
MPAELQWLTRSQIDASAWDACVAASLQPIVYGYSWYLDSVLPDSGWKWEGLVLSDDAGHYRAIMPVPLRRKCVLGIDYDWVVHQPLFCQMLGVFSYDTSVDIDLFLCTLYQRYRYCSTLSINRQPVGGSPLASFLIKRLGTHVLDLSIGYQALFRNYTKDRKLNLRRAKAAQWVVIDSFDPTPLVTLFRANHAVGIPGGVAEWAYDTFISLVQELHRRQLITLRYATYSGRIEAGALFVREGNRVIYLFNAASEAGRRGNARTLLIDQVLQDYAGKPMVFDFESPEKPSIVSFYRSFGAVEEPFEMICWSRLSQLERGLLQVRNKLWAR